MLYYVNINKKRVVGRNNQQSTRPITLEYDVTEVIDFQFIDDNNQLQPLSPNTPGLTLAIGLKQNMPSYDLLALSHDYEIINGQTLRFTVNTYTVNWLKKINKANTEVFIEISQQSLESKKVWMRDYCYVWPRVYTAGLEPAEIESNDYYTKTETDEAIENAIEGISGFVTEEQLEEGLATKQNVIDDENKLSYELLSGTPSIPTKTSDLENDSDFVTSGYVDDGLATKQDEITVDNKLDYSLISGTPEIPDPAWGAIIGTLSAQTDLQTALDDKADLSGLALKADQTDVAAISGELEDVEETLEDYILQNGLFYFKYDSDGTSAAKIRNSKNGSPTTVAPSSLQYSFDGNTWTNYLLSSVENPSVADTIELDASTHPIVFFRSSAPNTWCQDQSNYYKFYVGTTTVKIGGNIMSLVKPDYNDDAKISTSLLSLFNGATRITDASNLKLPATILAVDAVYRYMFMGCTGLKKAPKILPAMTLTDQCYDSMFRNCTALETTPYLPATTMKYRCYNQLFNNCTKVNSISAEFTSWGDASTDAWFGNWVTGVAASGDFYCPAALPNQTGNSKIPNGWAVHTH